MSIRTRPSYYILDGREAVPIGDDVLKWGRWMDQHNRHRVVAQTRVGGFEVSTVFIGLDHNLLNEGPPHIFETMVFGSKIEDEHCYQDYQERYSNWDEAEKGHARAVEMVESGLIGSRKATDEKEGK